MELPLGLEAADGGLRIGCPLGTPHSGELEVDVCLTPVSILS